MKEGALCKQGPGSPAVCTRQVSIKTQTSLCTHEHQVHFGTMCSAAWGWLAFVSMWAATGLLSSSADGASPHQIKVNLFGQPCILQGPVEDKVLQAIHSLSPEQAYPPRDEPMTSAGTSK